MNRSVLSGLAALTLVFSFSAGAASEEADKGGENCEPGLTSPIAIAPSVVSQLTAVLPSEGAQSIAWEADYGPVNVSDSWLQTYNPVTQTLRSYKPAMSAVPGRVRIMPVGRTGPVLNAAGPQVLRDTGGRVLLLAPREGGSDIFSLNGSQLDPIAVLKSGARLFSGLGDRPWVAWHETDENHIVQVKAALLEGLTTPAFSYGLDGDEVALDFAYDRDSEARGNFAVLTSKRLLVFKIFSK